MEAAIALMSKPVESRKRELSLSSMEMSTEVSKTPKKAKIMKKLSGDRLKAIGYRMFSKSLEEAQFSMNDNEGQPFIKDLSSASDKFRIRECFAEVMSLKCSLRGLGQAPTSRINEFKLKRLTDILHSNKKLKHLMEVCNDLKKTIAGITKRVQLEGTIVLKCHALIDKLYMELLPLAASLAGVEGRGQRQGGEQRISISMAEECPYRLPDPAAYLACSLGKQGAKKDEMNRILAYLELREEEAQEMNLRRAFMESMKEEGGLSPSTFDDTMRGSCPMGTSTMRLWQDACRDRVCHWSAFAVPDREALALIRDFSTSVNGEGRILELGAGTGYWARLLRNEGVKITPTDILPPRGKGMEVKMNGYHGCFAPWTHVQALSAKEASSSSSNSNILMLVYPPPSNSMAVNALRGVDADYIIYVGEFVGDTADKTFENALFHGYNCVKVHALPCWTNTADRLSFWVKKGKPYGALETLRGGFTLTTPLACAGCGVDLTIPLLGKGTDGKGKIFRDRLTRCVFACSSQCACDVKTKKRVMEECTLRHLDLVNESSAHDFDTRWRAVCH